MSTPYPYPAQGGRPMPTPAPPGAQLSPDGAWWWDGQVWRPRAAAPAYGYPAAAPAKRGLPTWAIVLIVVDLGVLEVVLGLDLTVPVVASAALNIRDCHRL